MTRERAELTWQGGLHVGAAVRDLEVAADKPEPKGGTNAGPMPTELYLAALGSCMSMSVLAVAEKRRLTVEALTGEASLGFDDGHRAQDLRLELEVESPDPADEWETVARLAPGRCTVAEMTDRAIEKTLVVDGRRIPMGKD
jgi:uncharacterized OsmC-like protein